MLIGSRIPEWQRVPFASVARSLIKRSPSPSFGRLLVFLVCLTCAFCFVFFYCSTLLPPIAAVQR
jgi:hypothetical protein